MSYPTLKMLDNFKNKKIYFFIDNLSEEGTEKVIINLTEELSLKEISN